MSPYKSEPKALPYGPLMIDIVGLVRTMYDARSTLAQQVSAELAQHFPGKLFETVIPRNVRLSEAPSHGKSIIHYDIKSKGAEAYLGLAKEIVLRRPSKKNTVLQ